MLIAGVDEVGRGAWAGPLVAAAVVLDSPIEGLRDSKVLSHNQRVVLVDHILTKSLMWSVALVSAPEIDRLGLAEANRFVMREAIVKLPVSPHLVRIDGFSCQIDLPEEVYIHGDALYPEISAASILAKVYRDQLMRDLHDQDNRYGYDQHVGYGTRLHQKQLQLHGPSVNHRFSFAPIRSLTH